MRLYIILLILFFSTHLYSQNSKPESYTIICYNVENLFDCKDDPIKNDQEFLPKGKKYWNNTKYQTKLNNIARVITSIGKWKKPILIGLCEIENKHTLDGLTKYSGLKRLRYKYIHKESPDRRGIDVALLYQPKQFKLINSDFFIISMPSNKRMKTRDILYASGKLPNGDTLHVFVNHFPSRYGGEKKSKPKRVYVASVLKSKVDSIKRLSPKANILIMGDFNDFPTDTSLKDILKAKKLNENINEKDLYNLAYNYQDSRKIGSNKYKGIWGMLDQFIVSGNLLLPENSLFIKKKNMYICQENFLMEDDTRYLGKKPKRTYIGYKYNKGYSDHLPIYLDLIIK